MIETITIKDVSIGLGIIVGILSSSAYLNKNLKGWIGKQFDDKIEPVKGSIDEIDKKLSKVEMESCKNYLARCIADIDRGFPLSETEKERFHENYENYLANGGNSYIKHKAEMLIHEGKL